ncbi:MAG TPA: hypothetical protein VKV03_00615 [Candidatus Binataceae bacterium]|nr:hypothetical protein [Candidatus Binataceae bacterium]
MKQATDSQTNSSPKHTVSERKASANRANAQRSTGPRTPEGKQRSSQNALRHGILAKAAFNATLEGEERRAEFDELVAGLAQEYQPRTMTEKMTVQQLAGCYWRLAKVWTFEQEAAWRARAVHHVGLDEYEQLERLSLGYLNDRIIKHQHEAFAKAGLGEVNLPLAASANTILRYQSAINSMMTKCLAILERRRKERMKSEETFEEVDYINEATPDAPKAEASKEKPPAPSKDAELHKRTQKVQPDAKVSAPQDATCVAGTASAADARSNRPGSD